MPGLFDTLNLGAHSLQVQQQAIEVAGHNLANVNNPAYARQRLHLATTPPIPTPVGPMGTGVDAVAIRQLRDALLDAQVTRETSVRGYLDATQQALQLAQAILGEAINRRTDRPEAVAGAEGLGSQFSVAEGLSALFNAFQSLSTQPSSLSERQNVLAAAGNLTGTLRQLDGRLASLRDSLNQSLQADVLKANQLLAEIANYNKQIVAIEAGGRVAANDLRDARQQRIEELARILPIQAVAQSNGALDITVNGVTLVSGVKVEDTLRLYDAGAGQWLVQTTNGGSPLSLTSGSLQGAIAARDGPLQALRADLNALATALIREVNALHRPGYSLTGSTGADFFTGTNAADIAVNPALLDQPALLQAAGAPNAPGDNQVALALAQLADRTHADLGHQTFTQFYAQTVANLGQELDWTNRALADQDAVEKMLYRQRDAISGVSVDEEMTDLIKFQKAFEASAKLIATLDEMLTTVVNMKR
jgi:flagellar hook-associated protein 1 FlgK